VSNAYLSFPNLAFEQSVQTTRGTCRQGECRKNKEKSLSKALQKLRRK
jgi:hypothetical protein